MSGPNTLIDRLERRFAYCVMELLHGTTQASTGTAAAIPSVQLGSLNIQSKEFKLQMERCASKQLAGKKLIREEIELCKNVSFKSSGVQGTGAISSGASMKGKHLSPFMLFQKEGEKQDTNFSKSRSFVPKESKLASSQFGDAKFSARKISRRNNNG